jgi:hypothetical protein
MEEAGLRPTITVREGDPVRAVGDLLKEHEDLAALVLGAAEGDPGPLVAHFAGSVAGSLPCPLIIIPGALGEADVDRLS